MGGELLVRQLPYSAAATTRAVWHRRHDHDAAHAWLREKVVGVAESLGGMGVEGS